MHTLIKSPPQPPPLSQYNAYTSWPGGIDPTASVFNTDNQKIGGKRKKSSKRNNRKTRTTRKSRKQRR